MSIRNLDPDADYAYDRTNQSASNTRWTVQRDLILWPFTQWAVFFNHRKIETGFADKQAALDAMHTLQQDKRWR